MRKVKVHLHLDHGRSPGNPSSYSERERLSTSLHYGYGATAQFVDLDWSIDRPEGRMVRFIRRGLKYAIGFDILHAYFNRGAMGRAEVVWARTEHEALAVAFLKSVGLLSGTQILGGAIWLWDEWPSRPIRRPLYRFLLNKIDLHTVQSTSNQRVASKVLGAPVQLLPYGANVIERKGPLKAKPAHSMVRVVAPGNDRHRDWNTLAHAVRDDKELQLTILSRRWRARRAAFRNPRVRVIAARSSQDVYREYETADAVVVPLQENLHNSGVTVAFEAALASRAVAISETGGLRSYLGSWACWAEVGNVESLRLAIRRAAELPVDESAVEFLISAGLTLKDYALRHVVATWFMTGGVNDLRAVGEFRPVEPFIWSVWLNKE